MNQEIISIDLNDERLQDLKFKKIGKMIRDGFWGMSGTARQSCRMREILPIFIPFTLYSKVKFKAGKWGLNIINYVEFVIDYHIEKGFIPLYVEAVRLRADHLIPVYISETLYNRMRVYPILHGSHVNRLAIGLLKKTSSRWRISGLHFDANFKGKRTNAIYESV